MHRFKSLLHGYMTSATPPDCATLDFIRSMAPVTYRPSAGRRRSATSWPTTPGHALSLDFSSLDRELEAYPFSQDAVSDALTVADQTIGPKGQAMTLDERMSG